jgi:hypothetical protein
MLDVAMKIKHLNNKIKTYYRLSKCRKVRKPILPGTIQSLWKAVKISKDINISLLLQVMHENGQVIPGETWPDEFLMKHLA